MLQQLLQSVFSTSSTYMRDVINNSLSINVISNDLYLSRSYNYFHFPLTFIFFVSIRDSVAY